MNEKLHTAESAPEHALLYVSKQRCFKHASQVYEAWLSPSLSPLASVKEEGERQRDRFFIMSEKCNLLFWYNQTVKCSSVQNVCDHAVECYSWH